MTLPHCQSTDRSKTIEESDHIVRPIENRRTVWTTTSVSLSSKERAGSVWKARHFFNYPAILITRCTPNCHLKARFLPSVQQRGKLQGVAAPTLLPKSCGDGFLKNCQKHSFCSGLLPLWAGREVTPGGRLLQFQVVLCLESEELKVEVDTSPQARLNEWDYRKLPTHKATLTHTFQGRGKTPGPWENGKHICFECSFLWALLSRSVLPCEIHH